MEGEPGGRYAYGQVVSLIYAYSQTVGVPLHVSTWYVPWKKLCLRPSHWLSPHYLARSTFFPHKPRPCTHRCFLSIHLLPSARLCQTIYYSASPGRSREPPKSPTSPPSWLVCMSAHASVGNMMGRTPSSTLSRVHVHGGRVSALRGEKMAHEMIGGFLA
jgi:hypothetical protein